MTDEARGGFPDSMFDFNKRLTTNEEKIEYLTERSKEDRGVLQEIRDLARDTASKVTILNDDFDELEVVKARVAIVEEKVRNVDAAFASHKTRSATTFQVISQIMQSVVTALTLIALFGAAFAGFWHH